MDLITSEGIKERLARLLQVTSDWLAPHETPGWGVVASSLPYNYGEMKGRVGLGEDD